MTTDEWPPRLAEIIKDARAIIEHIEEARDYYQAGDMQNAVNITALSTHKVEQVRSDVSELLKYAAKQGITPR